MELLIKNAKLVDEASELDADILVRNGKNRRCGTGPGLRRRGDRRCRLDADARFRGSALPFPRPGFTQKEDIETGCRAAAKGGYTAVNLMANTNPVCSDMETVRYIRRKAETMGLVDVHQCVSVTKILTDG